MSKFKKIFATMIGTAISANFLITMPFLVFADNISQTFEFDGYTVGYEVKNSWGNTEDISLTLTNTGTETIEDWRRYNGNAITNDIEMLIIGHEKGAWQRFVPSSAYPISEAIKEPQIYIKRRISPYYYDLYTWNETAKDLFN